jgi:hypothetical protein
VGGAAEDPVPTRMHPVHEPVVGTRT